MNFQTIISFFTLLSLSMQFIACSTTQKSDQLTHSAAKISIVPFELLDNRIFIEVMINGAGPYKFIFDTGGSNCITPKLADELGLLKIPMGKASGAGDGKVDYWQTSVKTFQFGDIQLSSQNFLIIDFEPIQRAFDFQALDGIFGYEVLQRFAASIDYEKKLISFMPFELVDKKGYRSVPFTVVAEKPVISGKVNNLDAKILIDTGDRSALTIFKNLRENSKVGKAFVGRFPEVTGHGIGGPIPAILSRIKSLELVPGISLSNVISRAPTTKGGFNAIPNINASIGNEVLKQFDLIFDYHNKFVHIRPNKKFGRETQFVPIPRIK